MIRVVMITRLDDSTMLILLRRMLIVSYTSRMHGEHPEQTALSVKAPVLRSGSTQAYLQVLLGQNTLTIDVPSKNQNIPINTRNGENINIRACSLPQYVRGGILEMF
jgi:hypothetical protein